MDWREREKVLEEVRKYLEELDKDPMSAPNAYDAESLALGAMFRLHPSRIYSLNDEVKNRVKQDELYSVFKDGVLDVARDNNWVGITTLEENKDIAPTFLPGNFEQKLEEKINPESALRQTGGLSSKDYQRAAEELLKVWKAFIEYKNNKNKGM